MSFSHLGLSEKVLAAVAATGYKTPTPIQDQAIPHVLARRDVLGIAQTGTGKTAAFVLPMLTMLEQGRARARMPRTLILEPTRELAAQVEESFAKYGVNHKLNVALIIGGVSFDNQDAKLTRGVDVLIATPGRLLDHNERGRLLLTGVELLVIDEADRHDVRRRPDRPPRPGAARAALRHRRPRLGDRRPRPRGPQRAARAAVREGREGAPRAPRPVCGRRPRGVARPQGGGIGWSRPSGTAGATTWPSSSTTAAAA